MSINLCAAHVSSHFSARSFHEQLPQRDRLAIPEACTGMEDLWCSWAKL